MAQQARPKVSGQIEFARIWFTRSSTLARRKPWFPTCEPSCPSIVSTTGVPTTLARSLPLERTPFPDVDVADHQDRDEDAHLHQAVHSQPPVDHRPRIEEDRFDVEQ